MTLGLCLPSSELDQDNAQAQCLINWVDLQGLGEGGNGKLTPAWLPGKFYPEAGYNHGAHKESDTTAHTQGLRVGRP